MEEKIQLGRSLCNTIKTPEQTKQDNSCKTIMKDRQFLACILKAVVPEYKDVSETDIAEKYIEPNSIRDTVNVSKNLTNLNIKGIAEEDPTVNEDLIKYDVIFEATAPEVLPKQKYIRKEAQNILVNLRIDIEAQNDYNPGYPISKRAMFYCARMLSSEFDGVAETMEYDKLYKVYSIWICFDVSDYMANTITRFKIKKEDVFGTVDIPEIDYNLMESVIIRLGKDSSIIGNRVIDFLNTVFGVESEEIRNNRFNDLGFSGTNLVEEVNRMMTFSERVAERNLEKGRVEMLNAILEIKKLYKEGVSIEELSKITKLPINKIKELVE